MKLSVAREHLQLALADLERESRDQYAKREDNDDVLFALRNIVEAAAEMAEALDNGV